MIPVPFRPLQEFEVILHFALDEIAHGNGTVDVVFAEAIGEDFEVLEVGVFRCCVEFDARHGEVEEDAVVDLAEGGSTFIICG